MRTDGQAATPGGCALFHAVNFVETFIAWAFGLR
jgi:hypothetical protein